MDLQKTIGRGAMTSQDVLALLSGERQYGIPELTTTTIFEQSVPKGFQPIADELRSKLELLTLDHNAGRATIYKAYGHDVLLLDSYRDGFKSLINSAVKGSSFKHQPIVLDGHTVEVWEYLEKHMPAMARAPLVELTTEIAAQPENELLAHLKHEVDKAVDMLLKVVCLWLDTLVTREFVGLIKSMNADTARYHYFRPFQTSKILNLDNERVEKVGFDSTKPFGQRTTYAKQTDGVIETTHGLERHDHDIVQMQVHTVADYPDQMPWRVAQFLEDVPDFILPHLKIVSGVIVREQVLKRTTDVETSDATLTLSTWLDSPAVVLADTYVPVGWSGRDMAKDLLAFFSGQKSCPPPPVLSRWQRIRKSMREHPRLWLWGTGTAVILLCLCLFGYIVGPAPAIGLGIGAAVVAFVCGMITILALNVI